MHVVYIRSPVRCSPCSSQGTRRRRDGKTKNVPLGETFRENYYLYSVSKIGTGMFNIICKAVFLQNVVLQKNIVNAENRFLLEKQARLSYRLLAVSKIRLKSVQKSETTAPITLFIITFIMNNKCNKDIFFAIVM